MKKIIAVLIIISMLFCACSNNTETPEMKTPDKKTENSFCSAVWLSYFEIASLCKNATEKQFREKIIDLAANLLSLKINCIYVHAVAFCDAFYSSRILPPSRYAKTPEKYDVFGIICETCGSVGIEVQAWINPYRVCAEKDMSAINGNTAAKKLFDESKTNLLITEKEIYLNPASQKVQRLIIEASREILSAYPVSAIHLDDYFYPDMKNNPDKKSYDEYIKNNGSLSEDDWRRENVNSLISSLSILARSLGKKLAVSPAPDIKKNYESKYADISFWLKNGWIDEIIPQIYFGFENENAPFEKVLGTWIDETEDKQVRLIIGLAFYKCGTVDLNAGSGKNEWITRNDIIARQIDLIKQKNTIYGVAFFSYSHIFGKNIEKIAKKELQNIKSML